MIFYIYHIGLCSFRECVQCLSLGLLFEQMCFHNHCIYDFYTRMNGFLMTHYSKKMSKFLVTWITFMLFFRNESFVCDSLDQSFSQISCHINRIGTFSCKIFHVVDFKILCHIDHIYTSGICEWWLSASSNQIP